MKIRHDGVLTFGKFAGCAITDPVVPLDYLEWADRTVDFSQAEAKLLSDEILRRLKARSGGQQTFGGEGWGTHDGHTYTPPPPPAPKNKEQVAPETLLRVIGAGRKSLAAKCHPDAGGDHADMVRVNQAADYLEAFARGLPPVR